MSHEPSKDVRASLEAHMAGKGQGVTRWMLPGGPDSVGASHAVWECAQEVSPSRALLAFAEATWHVMIACPLTFSSGCMCHQLQHGPYGACMHCRNLGPGACASSGCCRRISVALMSLGGRWASTRASASLPSASRISPTPWPHPTSSRPCQARNLRLRLKPAVPSKLFLLDERL